MVIMIWKEQVDSLTKVQEEVVMMLTKPGEQIEHGHSAHISKSQLCSLSRSGVMMVLVKSCQNLSCVNAVTHSLFHLRVLKALRVPKSSFKNQEAEASNALECFFSFSRYSV